MQLCKTRLGIFSSGSVVPVCTRSVSAVTDQETVILGKFAGRSMFEGQGCGGGGGNSLSSRCVSVGRRLEEPRCCHVRFGCVDFWLVAVDGDAWMVVRSFHGSRQEHRSGCDTTPAGACCFLWQGPSNVVLRALDRESKSPERGWVVCASV